MSDETFDLVRAVSFNSRRRTSKMEDLLEDNAVLRELLNQSLVIMEFLYTLDIKEYQDELNKAVAFKRDYAEVMLRIHKQLDETE